MDNNNKIEEIAREFQYRYYGNLAHITGTGFRYILTEAITAAIAPLQAKLEQAKQQLLNRELRWDEGEEFRELAERERDRLTAELEQAISENQDLRAESAQHRQQLKEHGIY